MEPTLGLGRAGVHYDIALVVGMVLAFLSLPALISAFSSDRSPRTALVLAATGGALILFATLANPVGYRAGDLPQVILRVIAAAIR